VVYNLHASEATTLYKCFIIIIILCLCVFTLLTKNQQQSFRSLVNIAPSEQV